MLEPSRKPEAISDPKGVRIHFSQPELLILDYILDPERPGKVSFSERKSGIRERSLGRFNLDGSLFQSVEFNLIIEIDKTNSPTVIMRADLLLGDEPSKLSLFQKTKKDYRQSDPEESDATSYLFNISQTSLLNIITPWSKNAGRVPQEVDDILALLQIWDNDVGPGSISFTLFNLKRYQMDWTKRYKLLHQNRLQIRDSKADDLSDAWDFQIPVGIPADKAFFKALTFYENTFSTVINALYEFEGKTPPNVDFEIEPPVIFKNEDAITFEDIGGQKEAVDFLRAVVASEKSGNLLTKNPLILLAGSPGNGKSSLVEATANELGAPLLIATTRSLPPDAPDSDYINLIDAVYLQAKAAAKMKGVNAVYCIENVEALLGDNHRLQDRFIYMMDKWAIDPDHDVLVTATSNFPNQLHPAIISRFTKLDINPPKRQGIIEIIDILINKITKQAGRDDIVSNDVDIASIFKIVEKLEKIEGLSGRDILNFLTRAFFIRRKESQESGHWLPMDTEFLLSNTPELRIVGFQT